MAQKDPLPIYFEKQAFAVQKGEGRSVPGNKLAADSYAFSFTSGEAAMLRLCFLCFPLGLHAERGDRKSVV